MFMVQTATVLPGHDEPGNRSLFVFFGFSFRHGSMTSGTSWQALQQRLVAGSVLRHAAGLRHPMVKGQVCQFHAHDAIEVVFHPIGSGVTRIEDGTDVVFAAGDVVLYAPGVRHDQRMTVTGEDCCVQIEPPTRIRLTGHLHVGRIDDKVLQAEIELLSGRQPNGPATERALLDLRTTAVLLQLLELALVRRAPDAGRAESLVLAAERYIQQNYARISSVNEIAAAVGVGPDHLRHVFRRRRNRSLVACLGEIRQAQARALLVHSGLPLKQIARLCGYRDEYYFSSVFRRQEGIPPGQFRERQRARLVRTSETQGGA
jgi:AraC-like DNA-binding protein/quercetin dioxygenase-like cupin family protein